MVRHELEVILFDLGGVLVELAGVPTMLAWLNHGLSAEELWRRWLLSPAVRRFEQGQGTAQEFAHGVINEFALPVTAEEFLVEFTAWPRGLYAGVIPLLRLLQPTHTLACFSNTNALHWDRICTGMGVGAYFAHHFASHLTGQLKPDRDAFEFVLAALGCPPRRVLFLDDNRLNIDTALAVGMQARRTDGFPAVLEALAAYGITLPPGL